MILQFIIIVFRYKTYFHQWHKRLRIINDKQKNLADSHSNNND